MPVLVAICVVRAKGSSGTDDLVFLVLAIAVFAAIFAYDAWWLIDPLVPGNRSSYVSGLLRLEFLTANHRINLPVVTGSIGLAALLMLAVCHLRGGDGNRAKWWTWAITAGFLCWALLSVLLAWLVEIVLEPYSQMQARNHSVFIGVVLAVAAAVVQVVRFWLAHGCRRHR